jgi:hypothetical protein
MAGPSILLLAQFAVAESARFGAATPIMQLHEPRPLLSVLRAQVASTSSPGTPDALSSEKSDAQQPIG